MRLGVVAEGRTDLPILRAVVQTVFGGAATLTSLQPQRDVLTGTGTPAGWTEVRHWCDRTARLGGWRAQFGTHDALIVQLDADVLERPEFQGVAGLPALCDTVKAWADPAPPPPGVVITLPAPATDAWLLAALSPPHRPNVEALPTRRVREALETLGVRKNEYDYRDAAPKVTSELHLLRAHLPELDRFAHKLEALKALAGGS